MGRYPRPDLPGAAFHLTARVQNGLHLFTPDLRDRIVRVLRWQLQRSDASLLAYVVMTNHLHLVVVQGQQPLGHLMQPFLRSVALATHSRHGTEGHVFERRFHDRYCRDGAHLRTAIAYTHANPVRAGICHDPAAYDWSSHRLYEGSGFVNGTRPAVDVATGLSAFVHTPQGDWRRMGRAAYSGFMERVIRAEGDAMGEDDGAGPREGPALVTPGAQTGPGPARPALDALAREVLEAHGGQLSIQDVRSRRGPRWRLPIRAAIALAASRAGYAGGEIAEFLEISGPTVSRMLNGTPPAGR
jgi:putative transposase